MNVNVANCVFWQERENAEKKAVVQTDQATADGGDSDRDSDRLLQEYRRTWIVIEI